MLRYPAATTSQKDSVQKGFSVTNKFDLLRRFVLGLALLGLLTACSSGATVAPPAASPATNASLRHIRLPMGFTPSVQFAPWYVAVDKGYFAAEGLALDFDYSFETNGVQLVGAGQLPFAIVSGEQVLLARAQSLPVVYILDWFQKFPVAVIAKAGSGINTPADLRGKHIGTPELGGANFVGLRALLAKTGIADSEVTISDIGFNQATALKAGQVDAAVVYANNEPIRLAAQGEQLNTINVSDYVSLAANGILTNEDTIAKDPDLIRKFLRAFARGLSDSIADPGAAYTISKKYVENLTDDTVEQKVLAATIDMWKAPHLGLSDPAAWDTMQRTLLETKLLSQAQDLTKTYTNEFVP
jgi:putative riboflavin transport system substrate-binding protein